MGDGRDHGVEVVSGVGSAGEKDKARHELEAVALRTMQDLDQTGGRMATETAK